MVLFEGSAFQSMWEDELRCRNEVFVLYRRSPVKSGQGGRASHHEDVGAVSVDGEREGDVRCGHAPPRF